MQKERLRIRTNLVFGVFAILCSITLWLLTLSQVKKSTVVMEYVDGRYLPQVISLVMLICGVFGIIKSVVGKDDGKVLDLPIEAKNLIFLFAVLAYAFFCRYVSFLLGSVLIGLFSLYFMRCRKVRTYVIVEILIISVCLVFKYALKVKFGGLWGI